MKASYWSFLDTLEPSAIKTLLRTVRTHKSLLDGSLKDLRRQIETGRETVYVIDYELLHRYLFERAHLEPVIELEYIFDHVSSDLFLGSGTYLELEAKFHRLGADLSLLRQRKPSYEHLRRASWSNFERLDSKLRELVSKEPGGVLALAKF